MFTFAKGTSRGAASARAMAEYMLESSVPQEAQTLADYYVRGIERVEAEGTAAIPRPDMASHVAAALGIEMGRTSRLDEVANLLQGLRADGQAIEGKAAYKVGAEQDRVSYFDLTFSAPKSVSIAMALAPTDAERHVIVGAHREAWASAMAHLETIVAHARKGHGGSKGTVPGKLGWVSFDHYTARPAIHIPHTEADGTRSTLIQSVRNSNVLADMQLHTHVTVPNVVFADDGTVGSIDMLAMHDRVHEVGALYQAHLATNLRAQGIAVVLDDKTETARMPAIPQRINELFSKRSRDGETAARDYVTSLGRDWDSLHPDELVGLMRFGTKSTRQTKGSAAAPEGGSNVTGWTAQAARAGYVHKSTIDPERKAALPSTDQDRLMRGYKAALPLLARQFDRRATMYSSTARTAAARGLIASGVDSAADIDRITAAMREHGVQHDGRIVPLVWAGVAAEGEGEGRRPKVKITTTLHVAQEQEAMTLAREAAADKSGALSIGQIDRAVRDVSARDGLDFTGAHGLEQRRVMDVLGTSGRLAVAVGVAGSGKTTLLQPLVAAWQAPPEREGEERRVYGTALATRQAKQLVGAGIESRNTLPLSGLLALAQSGELDLNARDVVVVDELGQIGTGQTLALLRLRAERGFSIVAIGDDRQAQAQPLTSLVLTPSGFRPLGSLAVGDLVRTPSGRDAELLAVSQQGMKDIFKITFDDGRTALCCEDHLWKVWKERNVYDCGSHKTRKPVPMADKWLVLPLREIKRWFDGKFAIIRSSAISLMSVQATECPDKELPVPPYALGALIGDGSFTQSWVKFTTADAGMVQRLETLLPYMRLRHVFKYDYQVMVRDKAEHVKGRSRALSAVGLAAFSRKGRCREIQLTVDGNTQSLKCWAEQVGLAHGLVYRRICTLQWTVKQALGLEPRLINKSHPYSPLPKHLAGLGLMGLASGRKFIPECYKQASVSQRLDLLRGLLDTDGHVGQGGTYAVFTSTSLQLALDVQQIAWSLGMISGLGLAHRFPPHSDIYKVSLRCGNPDILFSLKRKKDATVKSEVRTRLRIRSIESCGSAKTACIMIDDPDHLYVTDDYIVTHNSIDAGSTVALMRDALGANAVPEIESSVRQRRQRDRDTSAMFRAGDAAGGIKRLREDGHTVLVQGGHRPAVEAAADLWQARQDANAGRSGYTLSASAPTNNDARLIGAAIRERRRARGEVGPDQVTVKASDQQGQNYLLPLAEGDRVRLFATTRAVFSERGGIVGNNGSVVTVQKITDDGLQLETAGGKSGFVTWDALRDPSSGRVRLTYGDVLSIDAIQGATSTEHINALPGGSQSVTGFKAYVAQSRSRETTFLVVADGMERAEILSRRAIGADTAITEDDVWANVARNLSRQPEKQLATALLRDADRTFTGTVRSLATAFQPGQQRQADGGPAPDLQPAFAERQAERDVAAATPAMREAAAVNPVAGLLTGPNAADARRTLQAARRSMRAASQRPKRKERQPPMTTTEAQAEFADAIHRAGLRPKGGPVMDGQRHRVAVEGDKRGKRSGSYVGYLDNLPAGSIQNFKTGETIKWVASRGTKERTPEERAADRARIEADQAARVAARRQAEGAASQLARAIWAKASPAAPGHLYLARKGVEAHGLRVDRRGNLLVPMQDVDGTLWAVQTISADGTKLYMEGARKTGTFTVLGEMQPGQPIVIAEGYATAATMWEATGLATVAAFDAANIADVARALRAADPERVIVVAADNDHRLPQRTPPLPNVGQVKGQAAADEVGAVFLMPAFASDSTGSDWNDYAAIHGKAAVRALATAALEPHGITLAPPGVTQAQRDAARQRPQAARGMGQPDPGVEAARRVASEQQSQAPQL